MGPKKLYQTVMTHLKDEKPGAFRSAGHALGEGGARPARMVKGQQPWMPRRERLRKNAKEWAKMGKTQTT